MKKIFLLFLILFATGCITMTPEERSRFFRLKVFNGQPPAEYRIIGQTHYERPLIVGTYCSYQEMLRYLKEQVAKYYKSTNAIGNINLTQTNYTQIIRCDLFTKKKYNGQRTSDSNTQRQRRFNRIRNTHIRNPNHRIQQRRTYNYYKFYTSRT